MEYITAQGVEIPALGFGTSPMKGETCRTAVQTALETGYRHIDTAQMYENEDAVGEAIQDSSVTRDEVFLVTKVHRRNLAYDDVLTSVDASLDRLNMDTIDLLLIHSPSETVPIEESIGAMNELQDQNKVKHIGISNFSVSQMKDAVDASETPIIANQVKYNPFTDQSDTLQYCIENDIILTAYSPVAKGDVTDNETLTQIGNKYGKTGAQVALRWLLQQEMVAAIPKSAKQEHIQENFEIFDFTLTDEEMERIFNLQGGVVSQVKNLLGL
ncbi:MAG: aldo/keto reductase [Halobacteriaceae archaeon]